MTEILFYLEGGYVGGKPDYGRVLNQKSEVVYTTDYGVPIKEIVNRLIEHFKVYYNRNLKFIRHYRTKMYEERVLVFEEV